MSNSLDSFLTRIGGVIIQSVTRSSGPKPTGTVISNETATNANMNSVEPQTANDESSEESSGETSDGEQEKKNDPMQSEEIEEIHSEGSGDDMDLDETIDSQIGVRVESERQQHHSLPEEDDEEPVNILDTLPLEGAPIEGQEVTEADLLGKPILKDTDDEESIENDSDKPETHSPGEDGSDSSKRHADSEHSDTAKKKQKKEDGSEGPLSECETKAEKKLANMRRNIREVMDETQLDEATLSAQRQEMERLRRVQEQQRIIREVQRQIAINRQNSKAQTRVISLLQGKQTQAGTTISQSPSATSASSSTQVRLPSTVLLKVNSGSGPGCQSPSNVQVTQTQRRPMEGMRWQKGRGGYQGAQTSISRVPNRTTGPNMLQQRIRMMTPSVSISPVVPKKEPMDRADYYSDSEISDIEAEEALREKQMHAARKVSTGPRSQKQAKGKDVVTISSSSESSDDDCIVLSDPSGEEETDNEDDPSNSGMHTNDRYNIPDEHGRVLVNVGHPDTEPDVFLAPQVARIIKPHQIGGIRFLYDNIVESIDRYKSSSGFGCILAHSMGLGKTLQVASFCDIFFRSTTAKTVLCIMPINTLQNWLAEFNMWLPYEDANAPERKHNIATVKVEPGIEPKQEIKEECGTQSDISNMSNMSNMSRPISTESAHRFPQENTPQHMNVMPENPYGHQGYEHHSMMPNYMPESMMNKSMPDSHPSHQLHMHQNYVGDMSQTSLYNANPNHMPNFDPMKTDVNCHAVTPRSNVPESKFGMENQNPGNMYQGMENRQHSSMYPGMENQTQSMDNRNPGIYPSSDVHHPPPPPMYPNYDNASNPYPNYPVNPQVQNLNQDPKKIVGPLSQNPEASIKKEVTETIKKEEGTCTTKEELVTEEKKDVEKVKTPYSVDAAIGMDLRPRHFRLHILNDSHKTMTARARVIREWQSGGGVLLIGYELYRQLSLKKPNKAKRKRGQPFKDTVDVEEEDKNKSLLDEMHGALVNPGPDLVICDEGHRIKNSHASISLALKQMRTKRRIVLTGYPLQNNLLEYWCMVDFVRPNYLGSKSEFCNMFERPIQNGQCIDSTPQDIRLMRYRAHVLHALLEGFVQRRSHSVLQISLPRKEEYILLVRMTPHQRKLYDTFMNQVVKTRAVPNPLKAFAVCCKIWNHPDLLYHFLRKRQANEEDDLDLEETISEKTTPGGKRSKARQPKSETKKGKKAAATVKNKPAASVQPNATSSASSNTDNTELENSQNPPKQTNYPNYSMAVSNSTYTNSVTQGNYSQNYQNFRPNEQNAYYRNENNHGEYNEFYNNQNQPRYGNQPSFPTYTQTSGFNQAQNYPNQSQNYMSANEQPGSHRYPPGPPNSDFRPDQNQTNNYESSVMYPRQNYPYQDQARNYSSNMSQGSNNYPQVSNQSSYQSQVPNQTIPDYSSYGSSSQTQNYNPATSQTNSMYTRNENPTLQNSTMGYNTNQQGQNSTPQPQPSPYHSGQQGQNSSSTQSRGFSPNQQNQNVGMQNSSHVYNNPQSQNMPLSNQPHSYTAQVNTNPSSQPPHGFSQQPSNSMPQNQNHGYMANTPQGSTSISQNQIRGYPTASQNQMTPPQNTGQNTYPPGQSGTASSTPNPTHGYNQDQQAQSTNAQNSIHGYPHLMPPPTSQAQPTYPSTQQNQTVPPTTSNHGYGNNHPGVSPMPQGQTHRYGITQQGSVPPAPSQPHAYTPNQQSSVPSMGQNDQIYSRSDNQAQTQNYTQAPNASHEFQVDRTGGSSTTSQPNSYSGNQNQNQSSMLGSYQPDTAHQNQTGQIKGSEDPYWQRNYSQQFRTDQCSDSYYRDVTPNVNTNTNPNVNQNINSNVNPNVNQGVNSTVNQNVNPNMNSGVSQNVNTNVSHNVNANVNPNVNSSVNRYQNNYYPPQSYGNQSYEYAGNHNSDMNSRTEESKPNQANVHMQTAPPSDKNSKDMTSSVGVQSQPMHQNHLPSNSNFPSDANCQTSASRPGQSLPTSHSPRLNQNDLAREDEREKEDSIEKDKEEKSDDEILTKDEEKDSKSSPSGKEDPGIPYDWATELMKGYVPGLIDASAKMTLFFCILEEAIRMGDRVLAFSQSLFTLNLIEDFLARNSLKYADGQTETWIKNVNYYRLDGSTSALEREKLINEFNNNPKIHLFLVSTRAGSLGINLVGANRAIVFDASWNPCHDTQAVCRVYRYGQQKPCFVYRLVTDNCLERKIYDRQISKQGMADRVVDQCNPDAHLSLKEATTLSWDWEEDSQVQDFSQSKDSYTDEIMHRVLERHSCLLTKQPFHHESLLVDRKDKKLSQAEKRLARRGYELEKMAANCSRPSYNYVPGNTATRAGGLQIRAIRGSDSGATPKPVASVRPMQQRGAEGLGSRNATGSRWIPAEVWQRQGMSAQEMTLPLDVVIPTNSPDKGSIVLKAGQRVMVLKSPKGIYMQLESGKIIAIRTALKLNQQKREEEPKKGVSSVMQRTTKPDVSFPLRNNSAISIIPKSSSSSPITTRPTSKPGTGSNYRPFADKEPSKRPKPVATATAKPYLSQVSLTNQVSLQRLSKVKQESMDNSALGDNSNSSDSQVRTEQRVEEVRLEDVVAEVSSNADYSPSNANRPPNTHTDTSLQKTSEEGTQVYASDTVAAAQGVQTQHEQKDVELSTTMDNQHSSTIEKEVAKTPDSGSYGHAFQPQQEKRDGSNDEIIIEDPPQVSSQISSQIQQSVPPSTLPTLLTPHSAASSIQVQSTPSSVRTQEVQKNMTDSSIVSSSTASVATGTNTMSSPKSIESNIRETTMQGEPPNVPQGYPYAQYPRYYDYSDPRSRSLSNPYGTYFPSVPSHASNPRVAVEPTKSQTEQPKPVEDRTMMNVPAAYSQVPNITAKTIASTPECKTVETTVTTTAASTPARDDAHIPTAFTHPTSSRYPGPYPPGPYDPYSQHYPPAPASSAAYPPGGAPAYPAYGGPTYNTDYARMYSAFHGPPPPADPYIHRGYAPPSSHPPNYYPPFPHPPPPYPNYSFLSPYPNPSMPSEPQPPAQ